MLPKFFQLKAECTAVNLAMGKSILGPRLPSPQHQTPCKNTSHFKGRNSSARKRLPPPAVLSDAAPWLCPLCFQCYCGLHRSLSHFQVCSLTEIINFYISCSRCLIIFSWVAQCIKPRNRA